MVIFNLFFAEFGVFTQSGEEAGTSQSIQMARLVPSAATKEFSEVHVSATRETRWAFRAPHSRWNQPPKAMLTVSLSRPISSSPTIPRAMYSRTSATPGCASGAVSK